MHEHDPACGHARGIDLSRLIRCVIGDGDATCIHSESQTHWHSLACRRCAHSAVCGCVHCVECAVIANPTNRAAHQKARLEGEQKHPHTVRGVRGELADTGRNELA